jgi:hypothetical protein
MAAQSNGKEANAGGSGGDGSDKDPFCETFVTTLHEWCALTPPRRSFPNMYFKNLQKNFPDIFKNLQREAPVMLWKRADGTLNIARAASVVGSSAVAQRILPALVPLAQALLGAYNPSNGPNWSGMQQGMKEAFNAEKALQGAKVWDAYPDALSKDGKTWLEIKRPGDKVSDWQKKQHQAYKDKTGNDVKVAGCNCPGANCKNGNDCPEGYAPADPIK